VRRERAFVEQEKEATAIEVHDKIDDGPWRHSLPGSEQSRPASPCFASALMRLWSASFGYVKIETEKGKIERAFAVSFCSISLSISRPQKAKNEYN